MKLKLFLLLFVSLNVSAQNLSEIIEALNKSEKTKSIKEKTYAEIAKKEIFTTQKAPELGLNFSHAKERIKDTTEPIALQ
ncbi:hypothetical protein [Sulfurimonas sp. CS5]|uniref:hypothetical protein n=1 Tax=Sulfurimonas sp. CS5 TaxID=3391145 RepID=UPI0039E9BAB9